MTTHYFLDSSALIALIVTDHPHHLVMRDWLFHAVTGSPGQRLFAAKGVRVCTTPTVEGALIRFLVQQKVPCAVALDMLSSLHADEWHEFQNDSLSHTGLRPDGIVGHRQVTDAYLAQQARQRGGKLITLDNGLRVLHPDIAVDPTA